MVVLVLMWSVFWTDRIDLLIELSKFPVSDRNSGIDVFEVVIDEFQIRWLDILFSC